MIVRFPTRRRRHSMNPGRSVGVLLALLAPAALAQPVVIDAKEAFQLKLLDGGPLPFVGLYSFFPVPGEGRAFAEQQLYTTQRTDYWIAGVAVGGAGAGSILETVPSPIAGKDFFPDRVELVLPNLGNYWIMGRNGVTVRNTDAGLEQTIVPDGGVNADQSRAALTPTGEFRLFNFGQGFLGPGIFSNSLHSIAGTQTYWPSQASLMARFLGSSGSSRSARCRHATSWWTSIARPRPRTCSPSAVTASRSTR